MKSSDISVVIQGPITQAGNSFEFSTSYIVQKIRKLLPNSEIIVSTWNYENIQGIDADKIIQSFDPGAMTFEEGSPKPNNLNRMLYSTQRGLQLVSKEYCLKIRSDMMPTSKKFLKAWKDLSKKPKKFGLFDKQLLAYPIFSLFYEKDKKKKMPKPFHLSDWAFFGQTQDLQYLFDIPLVQEPYYSSYFINHNNDNYDSIPEIKWRYSPEQYLFYSAFSKKYYVPFENKRDYRKINIKSSKRAILENFIFLDTDMWSLHHSKYTYRKAIYQYDGRCYSGLIKFYNCILFRMCNFIPTKPIYILYSLNNFMKYTVKRKLYRQSLKRAKKC